MKKIKIGQIGIGHNHGAAVMSAVRKFPELFEVVGYAEENPEWEARRGDKEAYQDLPRMEVEELIAKCDAMLIESDVWDLTKYAKQCVDAGLHVHMDKPASGPLEDYKAVLDTAEEKGLVFQLGYMYRYNPAVRKTFELIREGKLGEIYSINAEMSTNHKEGYKKWLTSFKGGIMYILGCHLLDLIVYLLGRPNRVVPFLKHTGLDGVDFEDNNLVVLEYDKAIAKITVSSVEVNGYGRRQFVVSGSKGTASILPMENPSRMTYADLEINPESYKDLKVEMDVEDLPPSCRYDDMVKDFYSYCMGEKENPFTYAHDYLVQALLYEITGGWEDRPHNTDGLSN